MIVTFIVKALLFLLTSLFSLLTLPAMPLFIVAGFGYMLDFIRLPLLITRQYVGKDFFIAMIVAIVVLISVERTWHAIQWLWHKIRG